MTTNEIVFDAFIGPIFDPYSRCCELALFFTRSAVQRFTEDVLDQMRGDCGAELRVQVDSRITSTHKVCSLSVRGYVCEPEDALKEVWRYALIVNKRLLVNVDVIWNIDTPVLPPGSFVDMRC